MWYINVLFTYKLYFMVNSMHIVQIIVVTYIQQLGAYFFRKYWSIDLFYSHLHIAYLMSCIHKYTCNLWSFVIHMYNFSSFAPTDIQLSSVLHK